MKNLNTQILWSMLPAVAAAAMAVVSVPIFYHAMGEESYAILFYIGTVCTAFGFMDLGLGITTSRFIGVAIGKEDKQAASEYWATGNAVALPTLILTSAFFTWLAWTFGPSWFKLGEPEATTFRWCSVWAGLTLFANYYGALWAGMCSAHLDFKFLSIQRAWTALATMVGSAAMAAWTKEPVWVILFGTIAATFQTALLLKRGKKFETPILWENIRMDRIREMAPLTSKVFLQLVAGGPLGSLDRMILGRLAPAGDFAAFGITVNIGTRLTGLSGGILAPVFHNTTRSEGGDTNGYSAKEIYKTSSALVAPYYGLASIGLAFWGPAIGQVWLGSDMGTKVGEVLPWVFAGLCLQGIAGISSAQLTGINRAGIGLASQLVASAAAVAGLWAGWTLHPSNPLTGAAWGFFAARLVWLGQDGITRKIIGIPMREYLSTLSMLARQTLSAGVLWLAITAITQNPWTEVTMGLISGVILLAVEIYIQKKNTAQENLQS
jgi:hypothetical protein